MEITIGLYYNGARYLAAWLGRWTSADPIGMQAGLNLYQYCRGSPINYVDPSGNLPTFLGGTMPVDPWQSPALKPFVGAARAFQTVSRWKAEKIAKEAADVDARAAEAGGGTAVQIHAGGQKVLLNAAAAVLYAPGTFFDMVAGIRSSYDRGGPAKVLEDVVTAPKKDLDHAHEALDRGDWGGVLQAGASYLGKIVGVGMMATGATGAAGSLGPPAQMQTALATGGAGTAVGVTAAAATAGGGLAGLAVGLISLTTGSPGDDDPPAEETPGPASAGPTPEELLTPGGVRIGRQGASKQVRELTGGMADAQALFDKLSAGGTPVSGYPGTGKSLPGGGFVGLRATATGTGSRTVPTATIDVQIPGIGIREIKFVP